MKSGLMLMIIVGVLGAAYHPPVGGPTLRVWSTQEVADTPDADPPLEEGERPAVDLSSPEKAREAIRKAKQGTLGLTLDELRVELNRLKLAIGVE